MTTWRDLSDELTLRQMADLAASESFGYGDEALLFMARDFAAQNLEAVYRLRGRRVRR